MTCDMSLLVEWGVSKARFLLSLSLSEVLSQVVLSVGVQSSRGEAELDASD